MNHFVAALARVRAAMLLAVASAPVCAAEPIGWTKVTDAAGWQPRDSQGEVVFKDQLWIFGGWFDSFEAPPRDVWSSADGKTWKLVEKEAPWKHSDLPMTLAFKRPDVAHGRLVQRPPAGPLGQQRSLVVDRRRRVGASHRRRRLDAAHRRRRGRVQGQDVDPRRHRELLLRRREEPEERRLVFGRRQGVEAGDGRRRLVAAGLSPGGRAERQDLRLRRRQLRAEVPRAKRRLVLRRRRPVGAGHRGRSLVAAALVLGGRLSRPHVGARRLVEQSVQELGRCLALGRRQDLEAVQERNHLERAPRALACTSSRTNSGSPAATPSPSAAKSGRCSYLPIGPATTRSTFSVTSLDDTT